MQRDRNRGRVGFAAVLQLGSRAGALGGTLKGPVLDGSVRPVPDLPSQLEELLGEVWRQEDFERRHPFTCGVIREAFRPRRHAA